MERGLGQAMFVIICKECMAHFWFASQFVIAAAVAAASDSTSAAGAAAAAAAADTSARADSAAGASCWLLTGFLGSFGCGRRVAVILILLLLLPFGTYPVNI